MPAVVNQDLCIGCGACEGSCPVEAIKVNDEGKAFCDVDLCISCGSCEGGCPVEAITIE